MRWHHALALLVACGDNAPAPGTFAKHVIDPAFRSEGVTVFDVDRDGTLDIATEELWYEGPAFVPHEIRAPRAWDPLTEYSHCFGTFHLDVDADGWDDLIVFGHPGEDASWCANPAGEERHWDCHPIAAMASGESPHLHDLFGAGAQVLVMGTLPEQVLGWVAPDPAALQAPWTVHALTDSGFPQAARYEHGLGIGDINGDARLDIVTGSGWLEQPADPAVVPWPWHPVAICPNNCAHMFVHDFSGDGLADLIGTSPHDYGAWWWEQGPTGFIQHAIDLASSQNHAARLADLDGDGLPELVTGKRWWAHFDQDPGALDPALLLVYRFERTPAGVVWTREIVDDDSGIGSQFEVIDVGADGKPDIVVANKKGLHYFEQR